MVVDSLFIVDLWFLNKMGFKQKSFSVLSDRQKRRRIDLIVNEIDSENNSNNIENIGRYLG